ncbi:YveK family protein [Weissella confusa]|uniref:YveK family protein n=1 Tax=Weissella confusa TaxID=1583 RepID=UPI0002465737|nr:hypothetical protein [Weissella confusa]MBJ7616501.1 hypothetical protein [Weissella confusa]MBJ7626425.1 hypothetical protein [Weissella confusa]CCF31470.1 Polysaccharide biosynthesis protein, chain length regulator [Weissella confusa LBAE C39-2]
MAEQTVTNRSLNILSRRFWWLILFVGLLGSGGAYMMGDSIVPKKEYASVDLLVTRSKQRNQGDALANQQADVHLIATMTTLVRRPTVLQPVAEKFGMTNHQLARQVQVVTEPNAQLFTIQVQAERLSLAKRMANHLATQTKFEAKRLFGTTTVSVIGPASQEWRVSKAQPTVMALAGGLCSMITTTIGFVWLVNRHEKKKEVRIHKKWRSDS